MQILKRYNIQEVGFRMEETGSWPVGLRNPRRAEVFRAVRYSRSHPLKTMVRCRYAFRCHAPDPLSGAEAPETERDVQWASIRTKRTGPNYRRVNEMDDKPRVSNDLAGRAVQAKLAWAYRP